MVDMSQTIAPKSDQLMQHMRDVKARKISDREKATAEKRAESADHKLQMVRAEGEDSTKT